VLFQRNVLIPEKDDLMGHQAVMDFLKLLIA
jgi:hypothetical protein